MSEVEMAATRNLAAIDQHDIQFRQAAGGARHAFDRINHQDQHSEIPLHDLGEASGRHVS
ncbi:MAG: hypothetical protein E5W20_02840 [Mesorhizobium sp.]|nr:MAG: hypothetical protein E5W20_02840 [Mesorhizobium sp.]